MNCEQARNRIPLALYGDLSAHETAELNQHLAACTECGREYQSLDSVRQALDVPHSLPPGVDVQRILEESAGRQRRSMQRYRRMAVGMSAVAAGLLLFLVLRIEVRVGAGQLVVRWGPAAPVQEVKQNVEPPRMAVAPNQELAEMQERLRILSELVRALSTDADSRDQQLHAEISTLITRMELLKLQSQSRWLETNQDVKALYVAQFGKKQKIEQP